jgi:GGDEF domain-containing protein
MLRQLVAKLFRFDLEIADLTRRIYELSWDEPFGMWTRTAFLQFCRVMPRGNRALAFLDLDGIHDLNHQIGYSKVDTRIREAFGIPLRTSDIVARWYSGDEIVILFDTNVDGAEAKMRELSKSAAEHELSFVHAVGEWDVGQESVEEAINRLAETVSQTGNTPRIEP